MLLALPLAQLHLDQFKAKLMTRRHFSLARLNGFPEWFTKALLSADFPIDTKVTANIWETARDLIVKNQRKIKLMVTTAGNIKSALWRPFHLPTRLYYNIKPTLTSKLQNSHKTYKSHFDFKSHIKHSDSNWKLKVICELWQ